MNDTERHLDDIQSDIRRTRSRLDETLSAVEQRLDPGQLMDQGVHYLRNHGVTDYFVSLGDAAKRQPLPLALAGVSLAWLMLSDSRHQARSGTTRSGLSNGSSDTDSALSNTTASVKQAVHNATDTLAEKRDSAVNSVVDMGSKVSGAVSGTIDKVTHNAQRVKSGYEHMVEEQPLALGAIGLALGALIAASAPRTRREDRLMGGTSDRLMDEAKKFGREKVEHAKEAVSSTLSESSESEQPKNKTTSANTSGTSTAASPSFGAEPAKSTSSETHAGTSSHSTPKSVAKPSA